MTVTDEYSPTTALSSYYRSKSERAPARLWAVEKLLHDLAAVGLVSFFEGDGDNPTLIEGFDAEKLWLRQHAGVQGQGGEVRAWNGSTATLLTSWPLLTPERFTEYLSEIAGGSSLTPQLGTYTPAGTGAVDSTIQRKLREHVSVMDFGAKNTGDDADDVTNSIAFALAYASVPDFGVLYIPGGVYRVAETVIFDRATVVIEGVGSAAVTISGTFADGDVVRFGKDEESTSRIRASGFRVSSSVQKTSGAGIKLRRIARSSFDDVIADGQDGTGFLTDGIHFDAVDHVVYSNFQSFAGSRAVVVNGTAGDGLKADLLLLGAKISGEVGGEITGDGIVCAGGFGGLCIDDVNTIKVRDGLVIDRSEVEEGNREILVSSTCTLDSCTRDGLVLDDPADGASVMYHGWIASCGENCVNIKQWLRSYVQLGDAIIFNGTTNGILVSDATVSITLPGALFRDCGTAFNNAAGAANIVGLDECIFRNNTENIAGIQEPFATRVGTGNFTPKRQQKGLIAEDAAFLAARFGTGATAAPRYMMARTRSTTMNGYDAVLAGDTLGEITAGGSDGAKIVEAARIAVIVEGTPGTGDMPGAWAFYTTPDGSDTPVERLRIGQDGKLVHRANSTTVVDANSHLGLRSYTVATLPSAAAAARMIYVSDGTSNKRLAVSDGTNWRWPDGAIVS